MHFLTKNIFIIIIFLIQIFNLAFVSAEDSKTKVYKIKGLLGDEATVIVHGRKMRPNIKSIQQGPIEKFNFEDHLRSGKLSSSGPVPAERTDTETLKMPIGRIGPSEPLDKAENNNDGKLQVISVSSRTASSMKGDDVHQKDLKDRISVKVKNLPAKERPFRVFNVKDGPIREIENDKPPVRPRVQALGQTGLSGVYPEKQKIEQSNRIEQSDVNMQNTILAGPIMQYLADKYKIEPRFENVRLNMIQTPYGPSGSLTLKNIPVVNAIETDDIQERARAIARSLLEAEAELFAITDMEEIREKWIDISQKKSDAGYIYISYRRYINGMELRPMYIQVAVKPDNTLNVIAEIVPATPEIYRAASRKTLSEDDARNIISAALANSNLSLVEMNNALRDITLKKYLITSAPYVIWESPHGIKGYVLDAFTGEILEVMESVRR